MSVLDSGSSDYLNRLSLSAGPAPVAGLETTDFMDNFTAAADNFRVNFKSNSEEELMNNLINDQLNLIYQAQNPDIRFNPKVQQEGFAPKRDLTTVEKGLLFGSPLLRTAVMSNMVDGKSLSDFGYKGKKKRFQDQTHEILKLQEQFPDMGLQTWDQLMVGARNESQRLKEVLAQVSNNRTWGGVAGMLTGVMKEALTDPYVLASMMFGTSKIVGPSKSFNAMKAFYTEFLIGAGSEVFVQKEVYDWSAELQSPWSLKDAAVTILTVGGFAGVTRAGGSYVVDVLEAGKAAKTLRAQGENVKADTLENYIDLFNGAPAARDVLEQDAALKAIDDIQKAIDEGRLGEDLQVEIDRILSDIEGSPEYTLTSEGKVQVNRDLIDEEGSNFGYPEVKSTIDDNNSLVKIDTKERHTTKSGAYTLVRQKLHKKIIDGFLKEGEVAAKGEKPVAVLMGGGSAAGKGTLLSRLQAGGVIPEKGFVHIDPDLVKTGTKTIPGIPAYQKITKAGDHRAANLAHRESSEIANNLQQRAMEDGRHLVLDKTLWDPKKAKKIIKDLKDAGYDVKLFGVTADPSEALVRNLSRFFETRRMVVPGALLKRHKGFNKNFKSYAKMVSEGQLYDTTGAVPKLIAEVKNGKIKVIDKEEYNKLTARGKLDEKATTHKQLAESQGIQSRFGTRQTSDAADDTGGVQTSERSTDTETSGPGQKANTTKIDTGTRPVLDDPQLTRIMDEEFIEAQRIIDEAGDEFEIPFTVLDDLGNETTVIQSVKKVFNDIENDQKSLDSLNKCMGRAA